MNAPLLLVLDEATRAHLARALFEHRRRCRINAVRVPPLLVQLASQLEASAQYAVTGGQERTRDAADTMLPQAEPVIAFTTDETARLLSVSPRTVRRMTTDGRLPAIEVGGVRRIHRDDIEKYVSKRRQEAQ